MLQGSLRLFSAAETGDFAASCCLGCHLDHEGGPCQGALGAVGGEYSEDDVSELVEEDEEENLNKRKKGSKSIACRKRKKGGLLLEPGDSEEAKAQQGEKEEVDSLRQVEGDRSEEEEKKKEDALWASFLSDVGQKPKTLAAAQVTSPQTCKTVKKNLNKSLKEVEEPEEQKDIEKVTITKVFDFAGEEVRVTKEVDAASKEAKSFLEQQEKEKTQTAIPASLPTVSGVKRPSGMNSLLGKIGSKKQKMNTLEKSRLDWENFKDEQGIGEELAIHNRGKEGYIERKAFLDRVDHRQFEIERDIRLSRMKP
ncbi:craniofacial development protein 1 [Alligator sinensis]|uniref:Craniofacial development protein 1 n=1 Tax=Alligator sinensis TaxID=38654 RepID=A0A3Q0GAR5_ALLSI|nr:craniofacial development protein 1 [Alligator sinensis]